MSDLKFEDQLSLVKIIKTKKGVLFGRCGETVTQHTKRNEWIIILKVLKAQNYYKDKNWQYLRDTVWENMRRTAIWKLHNSKRGVQSCALNKIDETVIDILGIDVQNVSVNASGGPLVLVPEDGAATKTAKTVGEEHKLNEKSKVEIERNDSSDSSLRRPITNAGESWAHPRKNDMVVQEKIDLESKKLALEVYHLQLDALKKERELNLPPSELTTELLERKSELKAGMHTNNQNVD